MAKNDRTKTYKGVTLGKLPRSKVEQEIRRPTFVYRDKPLPDVCGFVPFDLLVKTVEGLRALGVSQSLKPDFLQNLAEFFNDAEDDEGDDGK